MKDETEILRVESLKTGYGENIILQDVSFNLQNGEALVIVGQNGSGKSTLLKCLCGLLPKKEGKLFLKSNELDSIAPNRLVKYGISYFVQEGLIMPSLTVSEHFQLAWLGGAFKNGSKKSDEVFDHFPNLYKLQGKKAGNLSGGERQMLSLGIMLMQKTNTWILDEPTAGLAPSIVKFTADFLERKNKNEGITMLVVEHNMDVAFRLASNIVVTKNGGVTRKFSGKEFCNKTFLNTVVYN
jgi:branched-chain amino acid transport system ATP-binding protein